MGSIVKHGNGWRAFAQRNKIKRSKVFRSRTAAKDWIMRTEAEIVDGLHNVQRTKTITDLLDKYLREESRKKRGYKWEKDRIGLFKRDPLASTKLSEFTPAVVSDWRDRRLQAVSAASVLREWNLLSAAINTAVNEWEWLPRNPMKQVKRPKAPEPRDRLISDHERELMLHTTGYQDCPRTKSSRVGAAFLFAIETGMRAGEIAGIRPEHRKGRTVFLPETKNGTSRTVPLSEEAMRILGQVEGDFRLSSDQISSLFRKARNMAGIEGLHFHDTRHQACTNLSKKLDVLELAKMLGLKDLKILLNVYYSTSAEELADKL